ncbi:type I polyketide synthase [Nonomuraea jiangxiensis]|uniref:Acyl transferase domain-containing protein n=1 Tax=Nonomuraea jiangxiensis TaxID=633440 RepID=A0A1G9JFF2_9ACTN|nr:type I polyketide synthase [Nonomuraea jiangxiensis]SDL35873.1 Acyl transferase domain-containing protein [Nonomuraea jiangxiensis]
MDNLVEPIAIIGMAGRFPGAADTRQLWRNLVAGEEAVRFPSADELRSSGVSRAALDDPAYVRAVAEPEGIDLFDAEFFGLTRREAEVCDPQLRLFLETSHAAVENAGYDASGLGRAGVFSSVAANRYAIGRVLGSLEALRSATGMGAGMWNNPDSASTLVSYKLNLHGPSMTVQTACSSSLVAVHLAVNALRLHECDVALAGGADVEFPVGHGYWWAQDGPLSRDGHCRPFDAAATGTIFGSGVGVVVLKRLADAVADGDRISAVIRAVAVNNDGANKVGFTAPSADRQAQVVRRAMEVAGVGPEDIGYVEAHATATRLGDAIEIAALRQAFGSRAGSGLAPGRCPIGSIKGNVGHLGHAAGITSLIKAALSLDHEQIPASINLGEVNPLLELDKSPFFANDTLRPWPRSAGHRRLAGVSSFGIGGTNAHAILEEAPARAADPAPEPTTQLIVWSARTRPAAEAYPERLARSFKESADRLSSVSFTLRKGRTPHPVRGAVVVESLSDAATAVLDHGRRVVTPEERVERSTVFLFPGEGAQHARMAAELYRTEPAFSTALDECHALFEAHGLPRRRLLEEGDTTLAQPALFSVEYALGRLWLALGIEPDVVLGHGIGEFAAATLAGVFTLPEAVRLVTARARATAEAPPGATVAVAAGPDTVSPLLFGSLGVAVVDGDRQTVVGGSADDVRRFVEEVLAGAGLAASPLSSRYALHTPAMTGAAERFRLAFDGIEPRRPRWRVWSASTGGPAQVGSVDFWVRQLTRPVLFRQALDAVLSGGDRVLVEVGPGRTLTTLARSHPQVRAGRHLAVPSLPSGPSKGATERASFLHALARMWTLGTKVDWSALGSAGGRVPLPGYPYQRKRHWIERASPGGPVTEAPAPEAGGAVFRLPTWMEAAPAGQHDTGVRDRPLVFLPDDPHRADELVALLGKAGWEALWVRHGSSYAGAADEFVIRPRHPADVARLLDELRDSRRYPGLIVDATQLGDLAEPDLSSIDDQLDTGFHRIVELLREAALRAPDKRGRDVLLLTELSADVTGGETVHPVRAMLLGLLRTYLLENPRARCKLVDVQGGVPGDRLLAELSGRMRSEIVALRGDRRWVPGERELVPDDAGPAVLRPGGAYVITGGLGGLGLALARGLAATGLRPRLLLLGRRVAGGHDAELAEIRALGAECRVEACDVTDVDTLRRVIDEASDAFGGINGVFHLAGVAGGGMLQFRTRAQMSAVLAPKVHGTLALIEVLRGRADLDFFVAFSSRAALRGLVGSADYAAANAFLDAVVRRQPLAGCASVTVNWPSWAEVGMAARQGRPSQAGHQGAEVRRWSTTLSVEGYPILDEHRMDDVPVLPGTAQVDFVLRAFHEAVAGANGRPARLRHMVFRQPITTPEPVSLEVGFEAHEEVWRFTVRTAPLSSSPGSPGDYRVHTTGEIGLVDAGAGTVDLDELRASLPERRIPVNDPDNRLFTIGPRWPGEEIWTSGEERGTKLAVLTFPEAFGHELDEHALHPTLLDAAVSLARDPDHEAPHAPFAYQSIVVHRPIPALAYSHIRRRPSGSDTIVADIDVLTAGGDVAVEVRGFTMRRVDESMVAPETHRTERSADAGQEEPSAGDGIAPATGVAMLLRLLGRPGHRQVAITLSGEHAVLLNADDVPDDAGGGQPGAPAPAPGRIPGAAPSADGSTIETRLTEMWRAAFGVESVAPDENFFDLGGDSFTAVELVEEIRRGFRVDVGIAVIFEHPTVAKLGAELRRLTG